MHMPPTKTLLASLFILCLCNTLFSATQPNVVLVMTDDQGYGDLGCHGNPILKTPNLDQLYAESIRLTDFHVDSFCTPTRAALMTGRYSSRTGAYRTSSGRTMLHVDETTMADLFKANGYATGIFGKWHLGDSYPHRPQDRGFTDTLWHRCGGVGQLSDYWGNDYFDDTYEHNGKMEKFEGYCTDIWFQGALNFIEANKDRPFFCYIPTNAPHGPYRISPEYSNPYQKEANWSSGANFYGMIANIDENIARLRAHLKKLNLEENTILIFMTDNGSAGGAEYPPENRLDSLPLKGYSAGMRGKKSSIYDGGHRVPCFIHWPQGNLTGGRDVNQLMAHLDLTPTLMELCNLKREAGLPLDGKSLVPLLQNKEVDWPDRILTSQFQGGAYFRYVPEAWTDSFVMTSRWRLLNGKQLYDIKQDPSQSHDIADLHPKVVAELRAAYEPWWKEVKPRLYEPVRNYLGSDQENPTVLTSQEWQMPVGNPPWNPASVNRLPAVTGPWFVHVTRAGKYEITLSQKPLYVNFPIVAETARLKIAGIDQTENVTANKSGVHFEVTLPAGPTKLETYLTTKEGKVGGAYFASVKYLGK